MFSFILFFILLPAFLFLVSVLKFLFPCQYLYIYFVLQLNKISAASELSHTVIKSIPSLDKFF